ALLDIEDIGAHGLTGTLVIDGMDDIGSVIKIESLKGSEADVLAGITFSGAPLRVYLAFMPMSDLQGDSLVVVSLYDDHRVEVRVVGGQRGQPNEIYAIYAMTRASP